MEYSSYGNKIIAPNVNVDTRPQISDEVKKDMNNLSNVDYYNLNRRYIKENKKKGKKDITKLTLEEISNNLIELLLNFSTDYNLEYYNLELSSKDNHKLYNIIAAFINYLNKGDNIFYTGIFIIIIASILYFFLGSNI